jgi:hypothetical protein
MRSQILIPVSRVWSAASLAWVLPVVAATSVIAAPSSDDTYLDDLQGRWIMQGTLGGKPVTYAAVGQRVLGGAWLKFHLAEAGKAPGYQADVFLGYDPKAQDFIVHWLDQFGAAGARVVATGQRDEERLVFTFPYAEGAFRDTFQRDKPNGRWTLLLESQGKDGTWSTFASYRLTRPTGK